eukprot:1124825-Prorocentrum_minimum.AAC.2
MGICLKLAGQRVEAEGEGDKGGDKGAADTTAAAAAESTAELAPVGWQLEGARTNGASQGNPASLGNPASEGAGDATTANQIRRQQSAAVSDPENILEPKTGAADTAGEEEERRECAPEAPPPDATPADPPQP